MQAREICKDNDILFGFGGCNPKFLQHFARIHYFVLCLSMYSMIQGMLVNGLVSASIPHLEREFGMTSTESGMILASNDITGLLLVLVISYYGENGHKPKWLGWGSILTGFGMLLFALPKFIKGSYIPTGETLEFSNFEICHFNRTITKSMGEMRPAESSKIYLALFCIANMLAGAGTTPLFTLGATYLDENVSPKKSPLFIGIWFATTLFGPSFGYFVAGTFLQKWVDPNKLPAVDVTSHLWVGRWWLPYVSLSWILLLIGVLMMMFPKKMPAAEGIRRKAIQKGDISPKSAELERIRKLGFLGFAKATIALIKNKCLIALIFGGSAKVFIGAGIGPFYSKLLVLKFNADPSTANLTFGLLLLVSTSLGLGIGSVVMSRIKVKDSVKIGTLFCIVPGVIAGFNGLSFKVPGCETIKLHDFHEDIAKNTFNSSCSLQCGCLDTFYKPVCSEGITYFSPCFTGCRDAMSDLTYSNCSCIRSSNTRTNQTVIVGKCDQGCKNMLVFVSLTALGVIISFIAGTPQNMIVLRSVPENQRSFAMGLNYLLLRAVGMLPGPIVVGRLLDSACLVWKYDERGRKLNCMEYKISEVSNNVLIVVVAASGLSTIFYILAYFTYTKEEELEKQTNEGNENKRFERGIDTRL